MAMLTLDCGRCGAQRMTHDVQVCTAYEDTVMQYEYAVQCRACRKLSIWRVSQRRNEDFPANVAKSKDPIDGKVKIEALVRPRLAAVLAPEHTPPDLKLMFDEGAECLAIQAWNAGSAMFRKIVDQISKDKMNAAPGGPPTDKHTQFNLKPRLKWLFDNNLLPRDVETLAEAIREDANDAVHNAPLGEADALDLQDFTVELLEALYTLPGRLREAEARRAQRRGAASGVGSG